MFNTPRVSAGCMARMWLVVFAALIFALQPATSALAATTKEEAAIAAGYTNTAVYMLRVYNPYTGEHLYTSNAGEAVSLSRAGWKREGLAWVAPKTSSTPVYRLYNPYAPGGDHHYTINWGEVENLQAAGWRYEGIGWYSSDAKSVPIYRQYNPYAQTGTHNYTSSEVEKNNLVDNGWNDERDAWYGMEYKDVTVEVEGTEKDCQITVTPCTWVIVGNGAAAIEIGNGPYTVAFSYASTTNDKKIPEDQKTRLDDGGYFLEKDGTKRYYNNGTFPIYGDAWWNSVRVKAALNKGTLKPRNGRDYITYQEAWDMNLWSCQTSCKGLLTGDADSGDVDHEALMIYLESVSDETNVCNYQSPQYSFSGEYAFRVVYGEWYTRSVTRVETVKAWV